MEYLKLVRDIAMLKYLNQHDYDDEELKGRFWGTFIYWLLLLVLWFLSYKNILNISVVRIFFWSLLCGVGFTLVYENFIK